MDILRDRGVLQMNIYILEDNWLQQSQFKKYIYEIGQELHLPKVRIQAFSATNELLKHLPEPGIQNIFLLDLEINGNPTAGLVVSRQIREDDLLATIIFITQHDELLPETFQYESEALDFIEKDHDDIKSKLTKDFGYILKKLMCVSDPSVIFKVAGGYKRINLDQILYFIPQKGNSHQSVLVTTDQEIIINLTLSQVAELSPLFFRAHRQCLVNLRKVSGINTHDHLVSLRGADHPLPLSRLKVKDLLKQLSILNNHS